MIHRFSVSNYHSIREEVALDLRIPATAPDLPRFQRSVAKPEIRLPTVAVLMGPNGSGKTTLLRALTAVARVVSFPLQSEEVSLTKAIMPFASGQTLDKPSRFRLEVEADWLAPNEAPQVFRYELAVGGQTSDFRNALFCHESLTYFPRGRARRIFERRGPDEPIQISKAISNELGLGSKNLRAIRGESSVIASLALLNVPVATRIAEWLMEVAATSNVFFTETWIPPTGHVTNLLRKNAGLMAWARKHLQSSDLGISGVDVRDATSADKEPWQAVWFEHHDLGTALPLAMESSGTKRLFHLLPQLHIALEKGVPAIVDEIDGDLHVDIVSEIVDWFHSDEANPKRAQLFVTSHNVGLLDDLEKEEVFIVEKTRDGATRVHGAQDVRGLRRDARLYPKYRAGVLGGIPKVG